VLSGPIQASDIFSGPANPRFAMQKESGSDVYSGFSNWRQCSQAIRTDSATRSRLNLQSGVPLDRVSILLGHSSIRITERHYSPRVRSRQEQLEADVRKVWEQIAPTDSTTISNTTIN